MIYIIALLIILLAYTVGFYNIKKPAKYVAMALIIIFTVGLAYSGINASIEVTVVENTYTQPILLSYLPVPEYMLPKIKVVEEEVVVEPVMAIREVVVEETKPPELRYNFTDNDIYLMARLLCGSKYKDGDGEYDFDYGNEDNLSQISLVLSVVMNRVMDDRFPDTIEEVILANKPCYQFEPVAKWGNTKVEISDIARRRVEEWCDAYNNRYKGVPSIPESHIYFTSNGKGKNVSRPGT